MLSRIVKILTAIGIVWLACRIIYIFRRRVWLDRVLVQGKAQSILILLLFVLSIPLLFWIIFELRGDEGKFFVQNDIGEPSLIWSVFYHYIDPGNQHMATSGIYRFIACVIALIGSILMNGILVSAFVGWYERFVDN